MWGVGVGGMEAFRASSWKEGKTFRMALVPDTLEISSAPQQGSQQSSCCVRHYSVVSDSPPRGIWEAALKEHTGIRGPAPAHFPKASHSQTLTGQS